MKSFKTPEEAIAACNAEYEAAWSVFAASHNIEEAIDPAAYGIAKSVFHAGFMAGAAYVSGYITERVKHAEETKKV